MANYTLAPPPYQTVLDNAGNIVPNACIWTYVAGTTTPAATYSDPLGTVNTNPIRADAAGRYTAYLAPGAGYAFVIEQPATPPAHGAVIRTQDQVIGTAGAAGVTSGVWLPDVGGTATYTSRGGVWVRIGPLVVASGNMQINTIGTGSTVAVGGLPFTPSGSAPIAAVLGPFTGALAPTVSAAAFLIGDKNLYINSLQAAGVSQGSNAFLTNGTQIYVSVTYLTSDP